MLPIGRRTRGSFRFPREGTACWQFGTAICWTMPLWCRRQYTLKKGCLELILCCFDLIPITIKTQRFSSSDYLKKSWVMVFSITHISKIGGRYTVTKLTIETKYSKSSWILYVQWGEIVLVHPLLSLTCSITYSYTNTVRDQFLPTNNWPQFVMWVKTQVLWSWNNYYWGHH